MKRLIDSIWMNLSLRQISEAMGVMEGENERKINAERENQETGKNTEKELFTIIAFGTLWPKHITVFLVTDLK